MFHDGCHLSAVFFTSNKSVKKNKTLVNICNFLTFTKMLNSKTLHPPCNDIEYEIPSRY